MGWVGLGCLFACVWGIDEVMMVFYAFFGYGLAFAARFLFLVFG